jgi:hypothetical protein
MVVAVAGVAVWQWQRQRQFGSSAAVQHQGLHDNIINQKYLGIGITEPKDCGGSSAIAVVAAATAAWRR